MQKSDEIEKIVNAEMDSGNLCGASIIAIHKEKVLYKQSFGFYDMAKKKRMKPDAIFRLYSLSKPITSVGVMKLIEQGRVSLQDPIGKYIETFQQMMVAHGKSLVPAKRELTVYDLLTMTSGIVYPDSETIPGKAVAEVFGKAEAQYRASKETWSDIEIAMELGKCPLAFQPGEQWRYGASADVLGAIIKIVTKQSLSEYLSETVFEPLGMQDTGFFIPKEKWERQAIVYEKKDLQDTLHPYEGTHLAIFDPRNCPQFESGGAGVVSTIEDYTKFAQMLYQDGSLDGKEILSKPMIELMKRNHLTKEQNAFMDWYSTKGFGYGFLVRVLENLSMTDLQAGRGTFGWDGWAGSYMAIDHVNDMIVLYFMSKVDTGATPVTHKIHNCLIDLANGR